MSTPLYTALQEFHAAHPLRMAMPGHKGQSLPALADYAGIDFTELPPTGNLYAPGGPIEAAEQLWAEVWGADCCLFLTGGSTQGVHTMLLRAAGPREEILADRVSHRSVHTGMALLDLRPVWLTRPWLAEAGVVGPVEPDCVKAVLEARPNIKTVCITSPTYYGVLSDITALSHICHAHGAKLLVDGAHGAHLFLVGENPYRGADYVVTSAHKTLRAPGQSALLFANAPETLDGLRRASRTFATSSPSYPMMAALDWAREYYCGGQGQARYQEICAAVEHLRRDYPALTTEDAPLDPARLVLCVEDGFRAERELQELGIYPEMADAAHVVLILTDCDGPEELARLRRGLDRLGLRGKQRPAGVLPPPPLPGRQLLTPREALFTPKQTVPLEQSAGSAAGEELAPYPPGVPVVAPGEEIEKKGLSYLREIGYNEKKVVIVKSR
ncbi:MAG: aminotransferase class V-fold PLP-dependent enzyme [Clostridiales bacterium]|nr:aminotransferase class V-fold PLP-dependent enzyme [Clostridiales bacterium]